MDEDFGSIAAVTAGAFAATVLIAFLASRLGLYLRRSSRYEPATVAGVHIICFFILGMVACSAKAASTESSGLTVFVAQLVVLLWDLLRLPDPEEYRDDVPQKPRALTGVRLAAVAAAALLGFGLVYAFARPASDQDLIAETEQGLKQEPGGAVYLDALKRDFPEEYRTLAIDSARRLRAIRGGRGEGMTEEQLGEYLGHQINALIAAKSADMAKAPTPALNAYARSMRDHALALQKVSRLACSSLIDQLVGAETEMNFPPAVHETIARILAARLDLARAGIDHPTQRPAKPPEAALRQLQGEIRRRDSAAAKTATFSASGNRCNLAVHYYSAITEMPAETGAILTAYDLRPPANPGSAAATAPPPGG